MIQSETSVRVAKEVVDKWCGITRLNLDDDPNYKRLIEQFATALDAEREACAVLVDSWVERDLIWTRDSGGYEPDADKIAAAIRSRGTP